MFLAKKLLWHVSSIVNILTCVFDYKYYDRYFYNYPLRTYFILKYCSLQKVHKFLLHCLHQYNPGNSRLRSTLSFPAQVYSKVSGLKSL